jgi:polyisoprenoid-binding protein YceI
MARPRFTLVWPALVALTVAFAATAGGKHRLSTDKKKPAVVFTVGGPAGLGTIEGKSGQISVEDRGHDIVIKVPLAGFKTGIDGRDTHFREKLGILDPKDSEKKKLLWPDASLVVSKADIKVPGEGTAKGTFKIHGVEKQQTFKYTVKKGEHGTLEVSGNFQVNVYDHGFKKEDKTFCFAGLCTKDMVDVKASFALTDG